MKYDNILTEKFFKYLESIKKEKEILDKEEKFFNRFKKAVENIKKK